MCGTKKDDHHGFCYRRGFCCEEHPVLPIRFFHPASGTVAIGRVPNAPANRESHTGVGALVRVAYNEAANSAPLKRLALSNDAREDPVTPKDLTFLEG